MSQNMAAGRTAAHAAEYRCRSQNIAVGSTFVAGFIAGCGTSLQVAEHRAGRTFVAGCISSSSLPVGRNESTGREAWQGQHATKPHASLPWQLSTANPERVALALCRAWPRLAWPNQGIFSCRRRPVRDRAHNHCDPLFAFSLNPEMQRIHNQRSVQCTGDRDGRQETPMGATAPSERPL